MSNSYVRDSRQGRLWAFIATTGGGKTTALRRVYDINDRVIVWDPRYEWSEYDPNALRFDDITELYELTNRIRKLTKNQIALMSKNMKIMCRFPESKQTFNMFCQCMFLLSKKIPDLCGIVEELHMLTSKSHAPLQWQRCAQQSRQAGLWWFVTFQRGQKVDDETFSVCKIAHITYIVSYDDRKYIADKYGVPVDDLPTEQFTFVHVVPNIGVVCKGRTKLVKNQVVYELYQSGTGSYKIGKMDKNGQFIGVDYSVALPAVQADKTNKKSAPARRVGRPKKASTKNES